MLQCKQTYERTISKSSGHYEENCCALFIFETVRYVQCSIISFPNAVKYSVKLSSYMRSMGQVVFMFYFIRFTFCTA